MSEKISPAWSYKTHPVIKIARLLVTFKATFMEGKEQKRDKNVYFVNEIYFLSSALSFSFTGRILWTDNIDIR